jgi:hypothetical protein
MSKNIVAIFIICLCALNLQSCGKDKPSFPPATKNDSPPTLTTDKLPIKDANSIRGICIFLTQTPTLTDADWTAIAASKCLDFIIIPKDAGTYGTSEEEYIANLSPLIVDCINKLTSKKPDAKIWIGTPGISSLNYTQSAATSLNPILAYINSVRSNVGETIWNKNIRGIYMNCEAIYGDLNYDNLSANSTVKLMSSLSAKIHSDLNKEFLWIPYYGYGVYADDIIKKIAHVACDSTIFDFVVIQPHYYFDETNTYKKNLYGVRSSSIKQSVCRTDGSIVTSKLSKTLIGAEMELDWHIVPPNNYTDWTSRFDTYTSSLGDLNATNVPLIFYWSGNVQNALTARINPFFQ